MASSQYSKSQELRNIHHSRKTQNRGSSILEIDSQVYLTTPPPTYEESTSPIISTRLPQRSNSLAPSYTSRSSASEPRESKKQGKSAKEVAANLSSKPDQNPAIQPASDNIARIILEWGVIIDNPHFPCILIFSSNNEDPLRLVEDEANKPSKRQLKNLDTLRAKLAEMKKRMPAEIMGDRQKMWEYQLEQFKQVVLAIGNTADAAVESVIRDLVICVKSFKCPSKLDFSASPHNPLVLAKNETNQPFIDQLCRLGQLRSRLAAIPTHGDSELEKKHKAAEKSIQCALQRMKDQQLKLYEQFRNAPLSQAAHDLDRLHTDLVNSIKAFRCPSELDFLEDSEDKLVLPNTMKNRSFVAQLRELEWFRDQLNRIPTYNDAELQRKHRDVSVALGKGLQSMKRYQRKLYEQSVRA